MDDNFVDIIIFIIAAVIGIVKAIYESLSKKEKSKKTTNFPEYRPYEEPLKRKQPAHSNPYDDFPDESEMQDLTLEEMIRRGLVEVVDDNCEQETQVIESKLEAESEGLSDYVEDLNAFAENLNGNLTYARNEAPVCEVEEIDYEDNVHDVDYAEFIRQNGKASIIISEILLPANSKMRK
jgi:hypothetical protein